MKVTESNVKYRAEFKKKTNWIFTIFIGIWIIALTVIFIAFSLIAFHERIYGLIFILLLMILIGAWVLDRFLWQIRGREELIITNKIEIIKSGKLVKSTKNIEFFEYESIEYDNDSKTPWWIKLYGLSGGKICIKYLGREVRIGQNINLPLAESVSGECRNLIEKHKTTKPYTRF